MSLVIPKNQKGKTIEIVLNKLDILFGEANFYFTDYWDSDLCAVGIKNLTDKNHLIYISTYNKRADVYFVEVEKSNNEFHLMNYEVVERFEDVNFDRLSEIIVKYLYLQPIYEQ